MTVTPQHHDLIEDETDETPTGPLPAAAPATSRPTVLDQMGLAAAVGVVAWTGSAKDFFVIGIWAALAGFVVALGSVLARRPLTGVVWNLVHGGTHEWRADRAVRRGHDIATLCAAAVFGARFVVKEWLYLADSTTWLAVAKLALGTPLTILAGLVVVRAFRRTSTRLLGKDAS
jgi:hypothetical protein